MLPTAALGAGLAALYLLTAHYGSLHVNDVRAAASAAWSLAVRETLDLSGLGLEEGEDWVVPVGDALYTNRFPGVVLLAVPAYALAHLVAPSAGPVPGPGAATAALASAAGVVAMAVGLRAVVPARTALLSALALGVGSGVWAVAADALWSHGATTLWLGLVCLAVLRGGPWLLTAGAAAAAVLSRPHLALAGAAAAATLWRSERRTAVALLVGSATGAVAYVAWVRALFGVWSLAGPYAVFDYARVLEDDPGRDGGEWRWRLDNVGSAVLSPRYGLLAAQPAALLLLVAWVRDRIAVPPRVMALALAGLAYGLVQVLLSRISGGNGFWGGRTLLEVVVLAWPLGTWLLAHSRRGAWWWAATATAVAFAVGTHTLGALTPTPPPQGDPPTDVFFWQVPAALAAAPLPLLLAVAGAASLAWAATFWLVRPRARRRDQRRYAGSGPGLSP